MRLPKDLNPNVAPQTVSVYTRHAADCKKRGSTKDERAAAKYEKRCDCPKWIYLFHDGKDHRFSAATRSWEKAEQKKQELERELDPERAELRRQKRESEAKRITIADAVQSYLMDARARHLKTQTLAKRRTIFERQLVPWTDAYGVRFLEEITASALTKWRATWKLAATTTRNNQELLRHFFRYCIRQGWAKDNPALLLSRVQVKQRPTDYFTREEFDTLLKATHSFARGQNFRGEDWAARLRTLVLLMRWSGLRIGDAARLERSRLHDDRLLLYQAKTGAPVFVPLPHTVVEALRNVPPGREPNPRYFFWSGKGQPERAGSRWGSAFVRLFEIAALKLEDGTPKLCKPHMLRDTFAVEMLLAGVPIEEVSMLLGHESVKTTERHYAPWVRARQEKLENSVKKSWIMHGMLGPEPNVPITRTDGSSTAEFPIASGIGNQRRELVSPPSQLSPDLMQESDSETEQVRAAYPTAAPRTSLGGSEPKPLPADETSGAIRTENEKANKTRQRKSFPYADVARMWYEHKTTTEIGIAIGRLDEGKDKTHSMRRFLTRMHKVGYKDASGRRVKLPYRAGGAPKHNK